MFTVERRLVYRIGDEVYVASSSEAFEPRLLASGIWYTDADVDGVYNEEWLDSGLVQLSYFDWAVQHHDLGMSNDSSCGVRASGSYVYYCRHTGIENDRFEMRRRNKLGQDDELVADLTDSADDELRFVVTGSDLFWTWERRSGAL